MEAVLARMRALEERLPPQDGVAVFNRVYLTVTETLNRRIEHGGFPAPRRAETLSVRFAERYLMAVEADRAPACWRPCCSTAATPGSARCSTRWPGSTRTSAMTWRSRW